MSSRSKNVVFDVVGTLVSYDAVVNAVETQLGERLKSRGIQTRLFVCLWMETTEREYTYLSMSGKYVPFGEVFKKIFWRMLWMGGIQEPREFASSEDLATILAAHQKLQMRPGAVECVKKLRDAGFTVWALTAGDLKRVGGYFSQAGVEMHPDNLISCDSTGLGKPDPAAYRPLLDKLIKENDGKKPWFAAAHMWDVSAARRTGFAGAYCTVWEKEPLVDLFGEMDVIDSTLPGMADQIIASTN
ncbi:hypothetical protein H2204_006233 [Knufia peltigerae]|uniref:Haloacid dehalogenase-like hydrolase n=1 Tax=Knufia peltigerae TaxID=1002370 RepID=A0AA39CWS6_9EURO|nr:hypothetical protein H2204_006233 [Knufia peltigerae]